MGSRLAYILGTLLAYRTAVSARKPARERASASHHTAAGGCSSAIEDALAHEEAEKELRRRAEEVETLMELAPAAIWVSHDPGCHEIFGNRMANSFYEAVDGENVSAGPAPGITVGPRRFFKDGRELRADELPMQEAAAKNVEVRDVELDVLLPSGQWRTILGSATPLREANGDVRGCVGLFVDITERKKAGQERERLLEEIQQRASAQEEFISIISHDLRTPITAIQGNSQMLVRHPERPDMVKRCADAIHTSARRMNRMIQDLVDSARLEAGQLRMDRTLLDAAGFVNEVTRRLAPAMDTSRILVETSGTVPRVLADPDRFERILTNLVSNALKYSDGEVVVRVGEVDGALRVSVADRGRGISPRDLPRLFERYYRADSAANSEGLGLGLYITRKLVEAHGGRIWAESEEGKGSTFIVELPVAGPEAGTDTVGGEGTGPGT